VTKTRLAQTKAILWWKWFRNFSRQNCWSLLNCNFLKFNCTGNCQDQDFDKWWISYNYEQLAP